jgi:hypothetical protein
LNVSLHAFGFRNGPTWIADSRARRELLDAAKRFRFGVKALCV